MIFDVVTNKLFKALLDGTAKVGKAKDSEQLGGKGASEYALVEKLAKVDGTKVFSSGSILEHALTLDVGVYEYAFGDGIITDVPSGMYKYSTFTIRVRDVDAVEVIAWGMETANFHCPIAWNYYNGTSWSGWNISATTADLANYLPKSGGVFTGLPYFGDKKKFISWHGNDLVMGVCDSAGDTNNSTRLQVGNATGFDIANALILSRFVNGVEMKYPVVHSGNVGSYALPIGGGTLTGTLKHSADKPSLFLNNPKATIDTGVAIDTNGDKLRIYEYGGSFRGASLDITKCANSTGSVILHTGNSAKIVFTEDSTTAPAADALWAHL